MKTLTFLFIFILPLDIFCQDQIMYVNGGNEYVNKIDSIDNYFLYYSSDSINYQTPLLLTTGHHTTIETKKNLSKKYHKRKRIYHDTRAYNSDTIDVNTYFQAAYIQSRLPENLSFFTYSKGFYVKISGDTIICEMALLKNIVDRYSFCVSRNNTSDFTILSAKQIKAYSVDGLVYRSLAKTKNNGTITHQFIENKIQGNLNLFEKHSSPIDDEQFLLISKKNSNECYPYRESTEDAFYLHSNDQIMTMYNDYSRSIESGMSMSVIFEEENLNNSFNKVLATIIDDCPKTVNKVKNNFYGESDLITIIKEYNNCF